MKRLFLMIYFAAGCTCLVSACFEKASGQPVHLTGSTPGDAIIKSIMGIDTATIIDFIRWDLKLQPGSAASGSFDLQLHYGVGVPNTKDFRNGGERKKIDGSYEQKGTIIHFTGKNDKFSLQRIDENVYHLVDGNQELLKGNGGWSYTISNTEAIPNSTVSPVFNELFLQQDTATFVEFVGRTPCQAIAQQMKWNAGNECWKLKWVLTLKRDPQTLQPDGFVLLRRSLYGGDLPGKWTIKKTELGNILSLIMNETGLELNMLIGNENVLFILNNQLKPLAGNDEFSFTLNRD